MLFDSTMLCRVTTDLERQAVGARIQRVFMVNKTTVVLELARRLARPQIVLACDAEYGRVHFTDGMTPDPGEHSPFGDVLRRYLRGATMTSVCQPNFDRILRIEFVNVQGMGPESRCCLVAEIMGKRANLLLLDSDETILECAKHVPAAVNRYRQSLPGLQYIPPPGGDKLSPAEASGEALTKIAQGDTRLDKWLRGNVMGGSAVFITEVCARAGFNGEHPLDQLPDNWPAILAEALQSIAEQAEKPGPGHIYRGPHELFAYPLVLQSVTDLQEEECDDISAALELTHHQLSQRQQLQQHSQRLQSVVRTVYDKANRRVREREKALQEAEVGEVFRRYGELILANLHSIQPGASEITVTDYSAEGMPQVTIALDPNPRLFRGPSGTD